MFGFNERRSLGIFGALLCGEHLLVGLYWRISQPLKQILHNDSSALCWPQFPLCDFTQPWFARNLEPLLIVYALLALAGVVLFLKCGRSRLALTVLILLNVLKFSVWMQDLRLGGNYHQIPFIVSWAFIFLAQPQDFIRIFLVLAYFVAGFLKINSLWIAGELTPAIWIPKALIQAACVYAVVFEIVVIWGLLSGRRALVYFVLAQLAIFHIVSIPSTLWFYPTIMLLLLTVFVLFPIEDNPSLIKRLFSFQLPRAQSAVLLVFLFLQIPQYLLAGDFSVTGQGRVLALNMYDGSTECRFSLLARFAGQNSIEYNEVAPPVLLRSHCDPLVYREIAESYCRKWRGRPGFLDFDWSLVSRSISWPQFVELANLKNVCAQKPPYSLFFANSWIHTEGPSRFDLGSKAIRLAELVPHNFAQPQPTASTSQAAPIVLPYQGPDGTRIEYANQVLTRRTAEGTTLWRFALDGKTAPIFSEAILFDRFLVFATQAGGIYALDSQTGQLQWKLPLALALLVPPVSSGDSGFAVQLDLNAALGFKVVRFTLANGQIVAESREFSGVVQKPLRLNDNILSVESNSQVYRLQAQSLKDTDPKPAPKTVDEGSLKY